MINTFRLFLLLCCLVSTTLCRSQNSSKSSVIPGSEIPVKKTKIRGAWFASGIYSLNIANNSHTYSKIGVMGGYLGNWGGYMKVAFDLVGNRTPNVVGGFTKRLGTFHHSSGRLSALYMYFGAGCGNLEHAGGGYVPGKLELMPDGKFQWVATGPPSPTTWDAGTTIMFDTGVIYRYRHMTFNLGYSITPDIGFLAGGGGDSANHSIQIGLGYIF
ncbi:MAG: hypothetical protein NC097_07970 [Clostridium sp.]|nr:hypothetical protein [Clostridium sp.]MCM1474639.1 hypothetical protein [Muribaculaceae bacterium]